MYDADAWNWNLTKNKRRRRRQQHISKRKVYIRANVMESE